MGMEYNSIKFMLWAKNLGVSFERTLTLGHQNFWCTSDLFRRTLRDFGVSGTPEEIARCFHHDPAAPLYADEFFRLLGAKETASVDRSAFEGATLLHDLNERFPENLRGYYDLVVDGGTLEHVFNYPAALRNCMELVRVGGHFVTFTPASGQMGHGFYQFSPDLLYRVFSADNGFVIRKIVLYDVIKLDSTYYEVKDPAVTGQRSALSSAKSIQIAVLAQKTAEVPLFAKPPQQSDYMAAWEKHQKTEADGKFDQNLGWFQRLRLKLHPHWPAWLRRGRDAWRIRRLRGLPNLNNHRHYRKLSYSEISRERA